MFYSFLIPREKIQKWLFVFLAAVTLIFDHIFVADIFEMPKRLVLWVGVPLLALGVLSRCKKFPTSEISLRIHLVFLSFLVMIILFLPSFFASTDMYSSLYGSYRFYFGGWIAWAMFLFLFLVASNVCDSDFFLKIPLWTFLIGSILAFYALVQVMGLDPFKWEGGSLHPFSFLGNPLYLGAFMAMVLPIVFSLILIYDDPAVLVVLYAGAALFVFIALQSLTRSAWLGALLGMGSFFFFIGKKYLSQHLRKLYPLGGLFLFVCLWCLLLGPLIRKEPSPIQSRAKVFLSAKEPSSQARLALWVSAFDMFLDHPFIGVGLENFEQNFWKYRNAEHSRLTGERAMAITAHNEIIQLLTTTGAVGMAGVLFLLFQAAMLFLRLRKTLEIRERLVAGGLWGALVVLAVFGEFNFNGTATISWAVVFLGCLSAQDAKPQRLIFLPLKYCRLTYVFFIGISACVAWVGLKYYLADMMYKQGSVYASRNKFFSQAEEYYARAIRLNPHIRDYYFAYARLFLMRGNREKDREKQAKYFLKSSEILEAQVKRFPWSALAKNNLAMVYMRRVYELNEPLIDRAKALVVNTMQTAPMFSSAFSHYAEILWYQNRKEAAKNFWIASMVVDPTYIPGRKWLENYRPLEYVRFSPQEIRISGVKPGSQVHWKDLRLLNDTNQEAEIALRIVRMEETLFQDLGASYWDLADLGWAELQRERLTLPASTLEKIGGTVTIPPWPWWRGKKFVLIIEAKDKMINYPFGALGRILIETEP